MSKEQLTDNLGDALALLNGDEWKQYILFIRGRARKLQDDVNRAVRESRSEDARVALAVMEDRKKQVEVFIENIKIRTQNERNK